MHWWNQPSGVEPPREIAQAVENLVPRLPQLPAACSLFFLDAAPKLLLRIHIADHRPPHLWLRHYLHAYEEELKETEYLVFSRRGRRPGGQDIYLVSARSSFVYALHVTPTGQMSWQKAQPNSLVQILAEAFLIPS